MSRIPLFLTLVASLAACTIEPAPLVASDVTVTKPRPGVQVAAGYMSLSNNTTQTITITGVTSPEFESVEMHESALEDGIARMYPLAELTILSGMTVTLEPGGKHLMLMQPQPGIDAATLEFFAGKAVVLTVNVSLTD